MDDHTDEGKSSSLPAAFDEEVGRVNRRHGASLNGEGIETTSLSQGASERSSSSREPDDGLPSMATPLGPGCSRSVQVPGSNSEQVDEEDHINVDVVAESTALLDDDEVSHLKKRVNDLEATLQSLNDKFEVMGPDFPRTDSAAYAAAKNGEVSFIHDEKYRRTLSGDTFSLMCFSRPTSLSFAWSIAIFLIQIFVFTLVAVNIIDYDHPTNPLGIPSNVDTAVRITQLMAIVIAVATQQDIRTGVNLLYDGYQPKGFALFGYHTRFLWALSIACRLLEGSLGLVVTFLLVVTEDTVVELLLNFTAMEFVSQLDEVAFYFASQGYIGESVQLKAEKIINTVYFIKRKARGCLRSTLLLSILTALLAGWAVVMRKQQQGTYLCEVIHVQLSDEFIPSLGTFSGIYRRRDISQGLNLGRVEYEESLSKKVRFAYCEERSAWTLSSHADGRSDPCDDWMVISQETATFDITAVSSSEWFVNPSKSELVQLQYFKMSCYDCNTLEDFEDRCGGRGQCMNNLCECEEGYFGLLCEFEEPCESLELDERSGNFRGTRDWSSHYDVLTDAQDELVQVYNRPVYVNEYSEGKFDIILFTGRRWVLTYSLFLALAGDGKESLLLYLSDFHAHFSEYKVSFITEPLDVGTPANAATPIGTEWFVAGEKAEGRDGEAALEIQTAERALPLEAVFLCAKCHNISNPCFYDAECHNDGHCECVTGSSGVLCQLAPNGNGRCDPFFNNQVFNNDGGDCCESTCTSSTEYFCGKDSTGYVDIGYPNCSRLRDTWFRNGDPIFSDLGAFSKTGTSVGLSGNGRVIAVSEPGYGVVRILDKDGKSWTQRGDLIEGGSIEGFGTRISMSKGLGNAVSNPSSVNPFALAVASSSSILVYRCMNSGCIPNGELPGGSNGFAISRDGATIAIAEYEGISLYQFGEKGWEVKRPTIITPSYRKRDLAVALFSLPEYVAMSRDCGVVAVGIISGSEASSANQESYYMSASLYVEVYSYEETTEVWVSRGSINSEYFVRYDFPKQSVALSDDGTVVAIGSLMDGIPGVQVYFWDGTGLKQKGKRLLGDNDRDLFGWSVVLSSDGSIVAAGTNSDNSTSAIRAFKWNGADYEQLWNDIPSGVTSALAIADDGSVVAVGLPLSKDVALGGDVKVYGFLSDCLSGTTRVRVSVTTDQTEQPNRWTLTGSSGDILLEGGPYTRGQEITFVHETCVNLDSDCLTFTMYYEGRGDGIRPPGGYSIVIGEEEVFKSAVGTEFFSRHRFGNCDQLCTDDESHLRFAFHSTRSFSILQWAIHDLNGSILDKGGPYLDFGVFVEDHCIPSSDCVALKVSNGPACQHFSGGLPHWNYQIFLDNELVESDADDYLRHRITFLGACDPLECEEGNEPLRVVEVQSELTPSVDDQDDDQYDLWYIYSLCDDPVEVVFQGGPYPPTSFPMLVVKEACIPISECIFMFYLDSGLASYNVTRNGEPLFDITRGCSHTNSWIGLPGGRECLCDNLLAPDVVVETSKPTLFETSPLTLSPTLFETTPPYDVFTIIPDVTIVTQAPTEGFETAPPTPFETALP
jgi:hypothetical protein